MPSKYPPHGRGSRPKRCRICGGERSDERPISARGVCLPCGHAVKVEHARQMRNHEGPWYDEWVRGMIAHAQSLASH